MLLSHLFLALAVVFVWGTNFVVIRWGLDGGMPPFLFATLRFALSALPWMLFMPRPAVPLSRMAAFGVLLGVGQFGLLYLAIQGHISPGLASLVIQLQVFFTIALAMRLSGERVRRYQWLALLLAAGGIVVIVLHTDGSTTPLGLLLVLLAALAWAGGNIAAKQGAPANMLAYVVWSSAFAVPPLLALSLAIEGWDAVAAALRSADGAAWAAVVWQAWGNSLFGYAAWGWLLARHPAATITPMALLVPVFGMGASALLLGEALPGWKLLAAGLVIGGLALNLLWPRGVR